MFGDKNGPPEKLPGIEFGLRQVHDIFDDLTDVSSCIRVGPGSSYDEDDEDLYGGPESIWFKHDLPALHKDLAVIEEAYKKYQSVDASGEPRFDVGRSWYCRLHELAGTVLVNVVLMHATTLDVRGKKTSYSDANLRAVMMRVPTKGWDVRFPIDPLGHLSEWQAHFKAEGEPAFCNGPAELEDDLQSHIEQLEQRVIEPLAGKELESSAAGGHQFSEMLNKDVTENMESTHECDLYKYTSVLSYPVRNAFDGHQQSPMNAFAIQFAYAGVYTRAQMMFDSPAAERRRLLILSKNIDERIQMLDHVVNETEVELEVLKKQREDMLVGLNDAHSLKERKDNLEQQKEDIKKDSNFAAYFINRQRIAQSTPQLHARSPTPTSLGYVSVISVSNLMTQDTSCVAIPFAIYGIYSQSLPSRLPIRRLRSWYQDRSRSR